LHRKSTNLVERSINIRASTVLSHRTFNFLSECERWIPLVDCLSRDCQILENDLIDHARAADQVFGRIPQLLIYSSVILLAKKKHFGAAKAITLITEQLSQYNGYERPIIEMIANVLLDNELLGLLDENALKSLRDVLDQMDLNEITGRVKANISDEINRRL
jgi:hypothetical protein